MNQPGRLYGDKIAKGFGDFGSLARLYGQQPTNAWENTPFLSPIWRRFESQPPACRFTPADRRR